ncbi:LruC domain-containing protein [Bacteroides sp. 214]|uniref:LruC domain-containing protein n=1 Tax=Bacteroides sp. 214 TaxID=2302935 RepID=UPI0013D86F60|nr:LruC domain-containing protein [Bacteroides sp. 214]NDW11539.1 LruC domain-containing protein [Bacteroides sp. 214]
MKKVVFFLAVILVAASCSEKDLYDDPYKGIDKKELDFSLTEKVTISSNLPAGTACYIYTSDPSGEGNSGNPIMVAYAPFSLDITVPKALKQLYSYVNGDITLHEKGNIVLKGRNAVGSLTRAEGPEIPGATQVELSDALITAINKFYPESVVNVWNDDIKMSSDLFAAEGTKDIISNEDGSTTIIEYTDSNVWLTYVTNGGSNFSGTLWYYTYRVNKAGVPDKTLDEINNNLTLVFSDVAPPTNTGNRVYLGSFKPGTRIGFKYLGNAAHEGQPYPKFSTPYYNKLAYEGRYSAGNINQTYNGSPISGLRYNYRDNEYTCGVIRTWEFEGTTYATLGMENRLPSESSWDGDFNDMICLIEADPICTENFIPAPNPTPVTTVQEGLWIFEDNYPNEGDYDFNDLVVKYKITETQVDETWLPSAVRLEIKAKGAAFSNSFGINGKTLLTDLNGYMNVYADDDAVEPIVRQFAVDKADKYIPMLCNGNHTFTSETYWEKNELFPCALAIPITDNFNFKWCLENKRIDAAYPRYKDWVKSGCAAHGSWYEDTPVEGLVWNK